MQTSTEALSMLLMTSNLKIWINDLVLLDQILQFIFFLNTLNNIRLNLVVTAIRVSGIESRESHLIWNIIINQIWFILSIIFAILLSREILAY